MDNVWIVYEECMKRVGRKVPELIVCYPFIYTSFPKFCKLGELAIAQLCLES